MKVIILSDIHGNKSALLSVLKDLQRESEIQACFLLGDIIDYGMHSNEVIQILKTLPFPIIGNIWGNHEQAVMNDRYERFSSERGRRCAQYTKQNLNQDSIQYIGREMCREGKTEIEFSGKLCLAVHGSLEDEFWKSIEVDDPLLEYQKYDYVFSGHSHIPHFIEKYYKTENERTRNRKKVIFINPGSVGQPRNLNNMAQYVILNMDSEEVTFRKVRYNIEKEQAAYGGQVDSFYKERLEVGI